MVVLGPEQSKHGAVETYEEAKRCAELFKSKGDAIDGVIVTLPNFGDERAIADTLRLARLGVPVLVQATPDTQSKMTITHRRDSFCGKMSACNNLTQYGIPYSLTTLHTETPDSPEFAKDLEWFAGVCRVVKGLRNLRIGALGARPTAFNTVRYSEKLLEASGISVETLDLSEVLGRIERMKDTDEAAVQKLQSIQKYVSTTDIPQAALMKMAKLGVVIDQWMKATDLQISAVQCWTSLEENLGVVPCTVMSMMSDSLLSSACEVDVCGVLGMHALQLASETPSALLDWNNNYGNDPNKAVCFHCSNLPKHFFKRRQNGLPGDHRGHGRKRKYVWNVRRTGEVGSDVLRALLDGRLFRAEFAVTPAAADLRTIRSKHLAARAWWKFPDCRSCCATSAKTDSSITWLRIFRRWLPRCMKPQRVTSAGICMPTRGSDFFKRITCIERVQIPWPLWLALILEL